MGWEEERSAEKPEVILQCHSTTWLDQTSNKGNISVC